MIVKHVAMKTAQRGDFAGLVKYITDSQAKNERVGDVHLTNCTSDCASDAVNEVLNTQSMNRRATADKTYHLIISFAPGETPSQDTLEKIEARVCAAIGFAQHQRISVVHHDTDIHHIHVAINKIHPKRYTMHEPYNAYHTLGKVCEKLEKEFGLQQVSHSAKKAHGENVADDMERQTHIESLMGWIKRECTGPMRNAQDWAAMHEVMRTHGLTLHERANGFVVTSRDGISVKASSIAREFSKANLEKKLGVFEIPVSNNTDTDEAKHYARQPLRSRADTTELYAQYRAEQESSISARATAWKTASDRKNRAIDAAKRKGRLKRAAIKLFHMPGIEKKLLYLATRKTLLEEIAAINKTYLKNRQQIYEQHRRSSWADWLRERSRTGNKEALHALRAQASNTAFKDNTVRGTGAKQEAEARVAPDSVTKSGTIIYRVGASAVRDDGDTLKVSRGASQAGLEAALRMAVERYGSCITINGSAHFKESIVRAAASAQLPVRFDDALLERRRRQLTQPLKQKEAKHEHDSKDDDVARRAAGSRARRGRELAVSRSTNSTSDAAIPIGPGSEHAHGKQSYARRAGPKAAPAAIHRMRGLSKLGLVHLPDRGEMLLPRDVSGHLEHQGAKPDHRVRRRLRRPGRLLTQQTVRTMAQIRHGGTAQSETHARPVPFARKPNVRRAGTSPPPAGKDRLRPLSGLGDITIGNRTPQVTTPHMHTQAPAPATPTELVGVGDRPSSADKAAEKYVIEREQKRCKGFDIPKHNRYNFGTECVAKFAGMRHIEGHALALLKVREEIFVLPVDESTARRLRRLPVGQQIAVPAHGAIKTKGRSR